MSVGRDFGLAVGGFDRKRLIFSNGNSDRKATAPNSTDTDVGLPRSLRVKYGVGDGFPVRVASTSFLYRLWTAILIKKKK